MQTVKRTLFKERETCKEKPLIMQTASFYLTKDGNLLFMSSNLNT